ncbi:hypothetical protein [Streptomyces sp. IBSBF 2394]|uniref:hypothetical protein n=1 Tax=Streptomyces sp. IBSBF 2394 TaxID=2903532 RepID=UPI002FDC03F7
MRSGTPPGQEARDLLGTPERVAALPAHLAESVRASYTVGLSSVFLLTVPLAATALVAVLLIRETPLEGRD